MDGNWSSWSAYGTECSVTCGGGVHRRFRTCTNPSPEEGGKLCTKEDGTLGDMEEKSFPCNPTNCYGMTSRHFEGG